MKIRGLFEILLVSVAVGAAAADIKIEDTASFLKVSNGKICVSAEKTEGNRINLSVFFKDVELPSAEIKFTDEKDNKVRPISFRAEQKGPTEVALSLKLKNGGEAVVKISENSEYLNVAGNGFPGKLRVSHRSKAVVIPDPISEDFVLYPDSVTNRINIPSDNFYFVNLLDGRNAMLSFLWKNENIKIHAGKDAPGSDCFNYTEISLVPGESVWIGLNAGENIWWKADGKEAFNAAVEIKWNPPFPARWAVIYKKETGIFPEEKGLLDRWFIIEKNPDKKPVYYLIQMGVGLINPATGNTWAAGLGNFTYSCNFMNGRTVIEYPKFRSYPAYSYDSKFDPVIYPFDRMPETPAGIKLPLTAVKNLLGDDTYSRITCVPSKNDKGRATCGATANIEKIFYKSEEKMERNKITENVNSTDLFVCSMRKRIEEYMEWNRRFDAVLVSEESNNKNISDTVCDFRKGLSGTKWLYAGSIKRMKTPEYFSALSQKIVELIDQETDEEQKEEQCKKIGRDIRTIGGSQDTALGLLRTMVKATRDRATSLYVVSSDEQMKCLLGLIRKETALILRARVGTEGK
ncbi:MAG: hypothetical protein KJ964_09600 [Verrucomicrobia bacterium]|nr:hypothetical protein [Verrucomicrobiota bacterium]MBU1735764.1 hypothetical protein [Verrucomicrobiota bacterium]MBU1855580.1 hypothetical protein [Verrucomicrobiota bacterium]